MDRKKFTEIASFQYRERKQSAAVRPRGPVGGGGVSWSGSSSHYRGAGICIHKNVYLSGQFQQVILLGNEAQVKDSKRFGNEGEARFWSSWNYWFGFTKLRLFGLVFLYLRSLNRVLILRRKMENRTLIHSRDKASW